MAAQVIGFVVGLGGEDKTDGTRREVALAAPNAGWDVQALEGAVEAYTAAVDAVVQLNFKTTAGCNQKLLAMTVCMCATGGAGRNVVEVKYPLGLEGDLFESFNGGDVALAKRNAGQLRELTVVYAGFVWAHRIRMFLR